MICRISASSTTFIPISGSTTARSGIEDRQLGGPALGIERAAALGSLVVVVGPSVMAKSYQMTRKWARGASAFLTTTPGRRRCSGSISASRAL